MFVVPPDRHTPPPVAAPSRPLLSRFACRQAALGMALVVLAVAHQFYWATQPRTLVVRAALIAAAATTGALPATATGDVVRAALRRYFPDREAAIDSSRFPRAVDVTFRNLDGRTCREAVSMIRRIDGPVAVRLEGYGSPSACASRNAMAWRIMP